MKAIIYQEQPKKEHIRTADGSRRTRAGHILARKSKETHTYHSSGFGTWQRVDYQYEGGNKWS